MYFETHVLLQKVHAMQYTQIDNFFCYKLNIQKRIVYCVTQKVLRLIKDAILVYHHLNVLR